MFFMFDDSYKGGRGMTLKELKARDASLRAHLSAICLCQNQTQRVWDHSIRAGDSCSRCLGTLRSAIPESEMQ